MPWLVKGTLQPLRGHLGCHPIHSDRKMLRPDLIQPRPATYNRKKSIYKAFVSIHHSTRRVSLRTFSLKNFQQSSLASVFFESFKKNPHLRFQANAASQRAACESPNQVAHLRKGWDFLSDHHPPVPPFRVYSSKVYILYTVCN